MRYVCLLMALVFTAFTLVQFNDLDQYHTEKWYLWVAAYGLCALISLISFFKRLPVIVYISMVVAALTAAVVRVQGVEWSREILYNPDNPSGNETGGLLVIAVWMGILAWARKAKVAKHTEL
ncbi:transmembrane 220 family protein [Oceaniferula spumae]